MDVRWMTNEAIEEFSDAELLLLLDATNGSVFIANEPDGPRPSCYVLATAEDAIKIDKLDAKWAVNADAFLAKLRNLSDLQAFELLVRLDCAWRNHERVEDDGQWIATAFERPAAFASDPANSNPNSPERLDPIARSAPEARALNLPLEKTCRRDRVRPGTSKRLIEVIREKQRAERCDKNN